MIPTGYIKVQIVTESYQDENFNWIPETTCWTDFIDSNNKTVSSKSDTYVGGVNVMSNYVVIVPKSSLVSINVDYRKVNMIQLYDRDKTLLNEYSVLIRRFLNYTNTIRIVC